MVTLAARREILSDGVSVARTPLLVPSFSSKGFPKVQDIINSAEEVIADATLVSAYDIHYGDIKPPFNFPSLLFLDSGGYEASVDLDLSEHAKKLHVPREWTNEMHNQVIADWHPTVPSVAISYDHPKERLPWKDQVDRAMSLGGDRRDLIREILIKPETRDQRYLQIEPILENVRDLAEFGVIGVTEKEIGNSIFQRMINIGKLRKRLTDVGLHTPIHIFGSLDTITTPLYFLAGADIFDGLTWLRFAFHEGQTIYLQNYAALKANTKWTEPQINTHALIQNYNYINDLELEMRKFLKDENFSVFKYHGKLFSDILDGVQEELGD